MIRKTVTKKSQATLWRLKLLQSFTDISIPFATFQVLRTKYLHKRWKRWRLSSMLDIAALPYEIYHARVRASIKLHANYLHVTPWMNHTHCLKL